jgi:hypothetical protein
MNILRPNLSESVEASFLPSIVQALDRSAEAILTEITYIVAARHRNYRHGSAAARLGEELHHEAVVGFAMEPSRRAKLVEILKPYMVQLREQRRVNGGQRCFIAIPGWGEDWRLIGTFLRRNHIEEGISAFAGYPLGLVGYSLNYSHPDEVWFKHSYDDLGIVAPSTVQMHFDLDNLSAKSMLYLNDVGNDNGPFSYVPETRRMIASRSQTSFFKYLDYSSEEFASKLAPTNPYRPLISTPALRHYFANLPSELQGSAAPGDDVINGTPLEKALSDAEECVTSDVGDLALFAGGEILHRGGVVKNGERWALQMIYKEPFSFRDKVLAQVSRLVRSVTGRSQSH